MVAGAFAPAAAAQKDAAEKAREGSIEHWIEFYEAERRKPPVTAGRPAPADPPRNDCQEPDCQEPQTPPRAGDRQK